MSKYPLYDSLVNQQSSSKGVNTAMNPLSISTEPVQLTRDDIIANLNKPGNWDLIKSSKFSGAWGDMWGTNQFDNYEEWKSWFMEQHPDNSPIMDLTPKGGDVTVGTENMPLQTEIPTGMPVGTSTMPSIAVSASTPTELPNNYMGQSIGGLADYLQTNNMPFGTMKDMGGVSNITPEAKAWRGKYSWE